MLRLLVRPAVSHCGVKENSPLSRTRRPNHHYHRVTVILDGPYALLVCCPALTHFLACEEKTIQRSIRASYLLAKTSGQEGSSPHPGTTFGNHFWQATSSPPNLRPEWSPKVSGDPCCQSPKMNSVHEPAAAGATAAASAAAAVAPAAFTSFATVCRLRYAIWCAR